MAKKPTPKLTPLSVSEIILRGEADVIRAALEARLQIDTLLAEREAAYARIAELESEVQSVLGDESDYPFPAPPIPVASFDAKAAAPKPKAKAPAPKPAPAPAASTASATPAPAPVTPASDAGAATAPAATDAPAAED